MKINREIVESYLGKRVEIKLFNGKIIVGELHKTGEETYKNNLSLYIPRKYYFLENPHSCLFRSSHIRSIKKV